MHGKFDKIWLIDQAMGKAMAIDILNKRVLQKDIDK